jgi:4-hydroxy-4-methyl-2-oxoglutarate aldolase
MTSTAPLPEGWNKLYSAVLSDALDAIGITSQAMPPAIRPLDEALVLCGRARTGIYMETAHVDPDVNPYELEIQLIDDLKENEVAILACGGSSRIAPWGSLLSTAAVGRKAAGCVTDGFVRDIKTIRELKLPVFHAGIAPLDSKGRGQIAAIDVPVICAGVKVTTGDLVFGDADGVVVVPKAVEAEVLRIAFDKINSEDSSMDDLRNGAFLRDVYARHGVL